MFLFPSKFKCQILEQKESARNTVLGKTDPFSHRQD